MKNGGAKKVMLRPAVWRRASLYFLPSLMLLVLASWLISMCGAEYDRRIISERERSNVELASKLTEVRIHAVASDLFYLASMSLAGEIAEKGASASGCGNFILFSKEMKNYEQICYIDVTGMETMRVSYNDGSPSLSGRRDLKFLGRNSLFTRTMALSNDGLYFSSVWRKSAPNLPLTSQQPLLSLGTAVVDGQNVRKGMVMLSYKLRPLFEDLDRIEKGGNGAIALVNKHGEWLKHEVGAVSRTPHGGMVGKASFARSYPNIWSEMVSSDFSQQWTEAGLFSWQRIDMGRAAYGHSGSGMHRGSDWFVVSHLPADTLDSHAAETQSRLAYLGGPLAVLLGVASLLLASLRIRQKEAEVYIREQNASYSRFVPQEFLKLMGRSSYSEVSLDSSLQQSLTVLFSDIRSYTSLSESLPPDKVIELLNAYFSQVNGPITQNNGFVDIFIGDALMALFPESVEDALRAVLDMRRSLKEFNKEQRESGSPVLHSGFGLHYGEVTMGTLGTSDRMQVTVIGDTVNLASRIESATKAFGCDVIISDAVYSRLDDPSAFNLREIDTVRVKGKQNAVVLYEVFDSDPEPLIRGKQETLSAFKKGIACYKSGDFEQGLEMFKDCLKICPEDGIPKLYVKRCSTMLRIKPGDDWQGITTL